MILERLREVAREGRLHPSLIVYGATLEGRREAAVELARTLLCEQPPAQRPCGRCRHCRRIAWPDPKSKTDRFHPDFHVLERDLRTATSIEATKRFVVPAYSAPFEARGQVFVVGEADSLSDAAADSLLKLLEEPPDRTPRNFLLLTPSRNDLLPTLRSRSMACYLGPGERLDAEKVAALSDAFGEVFDAYVEAPSAIHLLVAAEVLAGAGGWDDPRADRPWATAAAAIMGYVERRHDGLDPFLRRRLLQLAIKLFGGPRLRRRGITYSRILEGMLSRYLSYLCRA